MTDTKGSELWVWAALPPTEGETYSIFLSLTTWASPSQFKHSDACGWAGDCQTSSLAGPLASLGLWRELSVGECVCDVESWEPWRAHWDQAQTHTGASCLQLCQKPQPLQSLMHKTILLWSAPARGKGTELERLQEKIIIIVSKAAP